MFCGCWVIFCRGIWYIIFELSRISFVNVSIHQYSLLWRAYKSTSRKLSCSSIVQTPHGPVVSSACYHPNRRLETLHGSLYAIRERELARRNLKWNSDRGECIHSPMIGMMLITNLCHIQITSDTINALTKSWSQDSGRWIHMGDNQYQSSLWTRPDAGSWEWRR